MSQSLTGKLLSADFGARLPGLPETTPHPSVADPEDVNACIWCESDEGHQPECPLFSPDDVLWCDRCQTSYVSSCRCDDGDDH